MGFLVVAAPGGLQKRYRRGTQTQSLNLACLHAQNCGKMVKGDSESKGQSHGLE